MTFTPLVGTLAYLLDRDSDKVLIIRRDARTDDDHYGKVNGLGGKVEADEDVQSSMEREVKEESGLTVTSSRLRGTITFSDFGPKREQWIVFAFLVDRWQGQAMTSNNEGSLEWVERPQLLRACNGDEPTLPMWPGDRHFVPLVFDSGPQFHATMPYDGDRPVGWNLRRIDA